MHNLNFNSTLRDYLKVIFRQKTVVITVIAVTSVIVWAGLKFKTPTYTARVTMLISAEKQLESPYYRELDSKPKAVLTQSQIVRSNPVITEAVQALRLYDRPLDYEKHFSSFLKKIFIAVKARELDQRLGKLPADIRNAQLFSRAVNDLKAHIKAEPVRDTNLFTISVSDYSPLAAAIMANTVSRSYVIFDLRQQLAEMQLKYGNKHPIVLQLNDSINGIAAKLGGQPVADLEAIGPASVKIIEQASIPTSVDGIPKNIIFALAFFMSIIVAAALAFAIEYLDQTFRSPDGIEPYLNMPYLGSLPKREMHNVQSALAERINLMMEEKNLRSLLFVSTLPDEGATELIFRIGGSLSSGGKHRVLIIDTNLRTERRHKLIKLDSGSSLADILENRASLDSAVRNIGTNLHFIPAGPSAVSPSSGLSTTALEALIRQAEKSYDRILIDCNCLSEYSDGQLLCKVPDGLVLVIAEGVAPRQAIKAALLPLVQRNAKFLGAVMNMRTFPLPPKIYHSV